MRFTLPTRRSAGFTLIEVLIIAPIVILTIGGFVALMVSMASDILVTRDQNNLTYETQDVLDRIEQDTRLSTQFLVTSGTFTAPQGSDSNFTGTAAFTNATGALILGGLTTDKNPADSTRQPIFYAGQPNLCGSLQSYNRPFLQKVIYFVNNGSLWRRAVLPDYNTNATLDDNTVCSVPWQRNTCSPGYATGTRCQTNDTELMRNVDSFSVKYFASPISTTDIGASQALAATTIEVTVNGKKTTAGRDISTSSSIRATKLNSIDVDIPAPGTPTVSGQVINSTSATFSWPKVPLASSYAISYNINGGSWVNAINNSQTTTYTVNTELGNTVTMHVYARNSSGSSTYGESILTIPTYMTCSLQNGWNNYGGGFAAAGYTQTTSSVVMLKGLLNSGNAASGTTLCTLPVGYRPSARLIFTTTTSGGTQGAASRIDVDPSGAVQIMAGNNAFLSLDGIRFIPSTAPYTWSTLGLLNGWATYGAPYATLQGTLDSIGRTHLQGLIKNGTYTNGTPVASFTSGQRPSEYMHIPANSNAAFNYVSFNNAGTIDAKGINPNGWYSIQGMFYPSAFGGWTGLPLQGGWVAFGAGYPSPSYTKSSDNIVTVKGLIKYGATNGPVTAGTVIANLPAGYRPKEHLLTTAVAFGNYSRIDIFPNGDIQILDGNTGWTSLDAISFIAEQ